MDLEWELKKVVGSSESSESDEEPQTVDVSSFRSQFLRVVTSIEAHCYPCTDAEEIVTKASRMVSEIREIATQIRDEEEKQDIMGLCEDLMSSLEQILTIGRGTNNL